MGEGVDESAQSVVFDVEEGDGALDDDRDRGAARGERGVAGVAEGVLAVGEPCAQLGEG
jgi:hypothetical protein